MTVAMLGLPLVSVLLASLLLEADGIALMPLIIVAVVVSYVVSAHLVAPSTETTAPASAAGDGSLDAMSSRRTASPT